MYEIRNDVKTDFGRYRRLFGVAGVNRIVFMNLSEHTEFSEADSRFDRIRKKVGLFMGPAVFLLLLFAPLPLSVPAHRMAAIMAGVVIYWITEPIPIPITALLGPVMAVMLGIGPSKEVLASFGDPLIFLFIGSFLIAQAMARQGLDRRIAIGFLSLPWVGESPCRILLALGGLTAFLSMWISNTAATAMVFPIALGILRAMPNEQETSSSYATGMMLMIAFAASVGGIGTPIGTPPNLIGIAMIEEMAERSIGFFEWMRLAVPILMVMFFSLYLLLIYLHPPQHSGTEGVRQFIQEQKTVLGNWSRGEKNVLGVFLFAVLFWILPGITELVGGAETALRMFAADRLPESVVAIVAASLLFVLPSGEPNERTLSWKDASAIDWGTLLLFGGGLAIGSLMFKTGLSEAIGQGLFSFLPVRSVWGITFFGILAAIFVSELASNTASANMVIPVVIAFAMGAGVSPIPPALGATLGASYGFMLPVSTPPNAIVYSSGKIPLTKMIKAGLLFDLIGASLILLGLRILCPLLGLV